MESGSVLLAYPEVPLVVEAVPLEGQQTEVYWLSSMALQQSPTGSPVTQQVFFNLGRNYSEGGIRGESHNLCSLL